MTNLIERREGSTNPMLNDKGTIFIPCGNETIRLAMQAAWAATPFPLLDTHGVHQLSDDTYWVWNAYTLSWVQIATGPGTGFQNPVIETDSSAAIGSQNTILNCGEDSSHEVSIASNQSRVIWQYAPYIATLTLPTGMQFSNMQPTMELAQGDVVELSFFQSDTFPNNIVMIKLTRGGL